MKLELLFLTLIFLDRYINQIDCDIYCSRNVTRRTNYVYEFSDNQTTADNALAVCSTLNGSLIDLNDEDLKKDLIEHSINKYIRKRTGLLLIRIYQNPNDSRYFKFRPELRGQPLGINDPQNISSWMAPSENGRLRSIRLYQNSATNVATRLIHFCYGNTSDQFRAHDRNCADGYHNNYDARGRSIAKNSITVYNHYTENRASNFFLTDDYYNGSLRRNPANARFFIPDISVFTGARSDVNQSNWFWDNDDTMITADDNYPPSDTSVCEQMTWPLTYDDGINLHPKLCSDEAYYICQIKVSVSVEASPDKCNGSVLFIKWKLSGPEKVLPNVTVEIFLDEEKKDLMADPDSNSRGMITRLEQNTSYDIQIFLDEEKKDLLADPDSNSQGMITRLKQNTSYDIQVNISSAKCNHFGASASTIAKTAQEKPDRVLNPRTLNNVTSDCVIEWNYEADSGQDLYFVIVAEFGNNVTEINISSPDVTMLQTRKVAWHEVELSRFPFSADVRFKIQSVSISCGVRSDPTQVIGHCSVPEQSGTSKLSSSSVLLHVVVPVCAVVTVILIITVVICCRRKRTNQTGTDPKLKRESSRSTLDVQYYVSKHEVDHGQLQDTTQSQRSSQIQSRPISLPVSDNIYHEESKEDHEVDNDALQSKADYVNIKVQEAVQDDKGSTSHDSDPETKGDNVEYANLANDDLYQNI